MEVQHSSSQASPCGALAKIFLGLLRGICTGENQLRRLKVILLAGFLCGSFGFDAKAATLKLESGPKQVALLELFTSQGCSSCPRREAWLSRKIQEKDLFKTFVPIAFHVDYWNGQWKDPFSSPLYTQRQRSYAKLWHSGYTQRQRSDGKLWRSMSMYTPCFAINGKEWRGGPRPLAKAEAGKLSAELKNGRIKASYTPPPQFQSKKLRLHLVLLGFGFETKVPRGENAGRTLKSDFVALAYAAHDAPDGANPPDWSLELPRPSVKAKRYAVALWISEAGSNVPMQALGGWLPDASFKQADK